MITSLVLKVFLPFLDTLMGNNWHVMVFLRTHCFLKTRLLDIIYLAQGLDWEIGEGKASGQGLSRERGLVYGGLEITTGQQRDIHRRS